MKSFRRASGVVAGTVAMGWLLATTAYACSPPFEEPTIQALGPAQVVVIGMIGERVEGGRLFHVQRSYNGGVATTPIVIAFKEGEPVGDCSYPVSTGANLIIAPFREPDGRLSANLATLQADPASDVGRRYVAEATALFGPGVVPPTSVAPDASAAPDVRLLVAAVAAGVGLLFVVVVLIVRRQRDGLDRRLTSHGRIRDELQCRGPAQRASRNLRARRPFGRPTAPARDEAVRRRQPR